MSQLVEYPLAHTRRYRISHQVIEGLVYAVPLSALLWVALIAIASNLF